MDRGHHRKGHLDRLARAVGGDAAIAGLIDLAPGDLQSLLLHVFAERAERAAPLELLARMESAPTFAPGYVDPRVAGDFAAAAFEVAGDFEAVELSPVVPFGLARALAGIHANSVLTATRGAELVSDPTLPLALLAASRRRAPADRVRPVQLCASHRVVRMQRVPPGLLPHFRLFALATAEQRGREEETLRRHIELYLRLFRHLGGRGYAFEEVAVDLCDTEAVEHRLGAEAREAVRREVRTHHWADADELAARYGLEPLRGDPAAVLAAARLPPAIARRLERLAGAVLAPLAADYPEARLRLDLTRLEGLGYYSGPCLRIGARPPGDSFCTLVDGGFIGWTADLLTDQRERFLSSGIGADLVCAKFRR